MLLVQTKIGPSTIEGTGLFADQFISQDTVIWRFAPGLDIERTKDEYENLPEPAKSFWQRYAYFHEGKQKFVLGFDHDRFINHSETPNVGIGPDLNDEEGCEYALHDIQPGEELTCNYRYFDAAHAAKLV